MTCLSGSAQAQQETSTMYTAEAMVMLKSRCLKERQMLEISWWLVSVQGSIYAIRRPESILKPVNQQYRENIYQLETKRKGKMPCTENINTHVTSGWCVHITFSYGDVFDPLEMYCGIDCVERFMEHNKDGVICSCLQHFHSNQWQSLLVWWKQNAKLQKNFTFGLKSLMPLIIERSKITAITQVYIKEQAFKE